MKKVLQISLVVVAILALMLIAVACGKTVNIGVDFIVDGTTYAQVSTAGQETISLPKDPTKDGYVFRGWYWDKDVWSREFTVNSLMNQPLTESIKVYAYFITQAEADSIKTVTFNTMGAGSLDPVEIKNGNLLAEPAALTKEGYLFVGWYREADFTTKWNFKTDLVQETMTLYAKWVEDIPENRLYTVAFNSNGGSAVASITEIRYNTLIQKPANPTNGDYALVGWYKDNTFAEEWNFELDRVTENRTLYARYQQADVTACALVSATGFTIDDKNLSIKVANGDETFSFLERITVSPFASWTVVNDLQGKDAVPSGNVEIAVGDNVKYILITSYDGLHKSFYTVTIHRRLMYNVSLIHANGTDDDLRVPYEEDSAIIFPTLTLTGYTLNGWLNEEGEAWDAETDTVQGDVTLTADWSANTYAVSFDSAEGSAVEEDEATFDAAFTFAVPERTGYTFLGWTYENELLTDGTGASLAPWTIDEEVTLLASWSEVAYTITYENLKGAANTNAVTYTITQEATFTALSQDGYTFIGWKDEAGEAITGLAVGSLGNRTITADWDLITYTATFLADGEVVDAREFNVETLEVVEPTIPAKLGYTTVWATYSFPAHNIEINAIYTPIVYTITYEGLTGEYDIDAVTNSNPTTYTIESAAIIFTSPSKSGYTFDGWTDEEEQAISEIPAMSTGNRTITAHWSAISYTITYAGLVGDYDVDTLVNENATSYTIESATITLADASKTGYAFDGWTDEQGAKITSIPANTIGNRTITAHWTAITYTITYANVAGAYDIDTPVNFNPTTYTIESAAINLEDASKGAYTFDGWTLADEAVTVIPAKSYGDKVITAHWTAISYTLTFIWNDEIGGYKDGESNPATYTVEDDITFKVLENKAVGYISLGWFTSKNEGTGDLVMGISPRTTGNKAFYAHWGLEEYVITYHGADGVQNTNATTYTVESEAFAINDLSKLGYDFDGWFTDADFNDAAPTTITKGSHGDLDFYAKWTPIDYTLTFVLNGGHYEDAANPATYTIEDQVSLLPLLRDGFSFDSWFTEAEGGERVQSIEKGTTGNLTFYARWKRVITFDSNGGSAVASLVEAEGKAISAPTAPTKDYYDFVGWFRDEELTQEFTFSVMPSENLVLYAKWTPTVYTITYEMYDGENHGSNPATYTVESSEITLLTPSKVGYHFIGWFANANFTEERSVIAHGLHGNIVVYASFAINQYTISFETNGGTSVAEITQNYATEVTAPASPAKNGYTFGGWFKDSALKTPYAFTTIPAENITVYAKWNLVTYDIHYHLDNGTNNKNNAATFTIESADITLLMPEKRGYTFSGWFAENTFDTEVTSIPHGTFGDVSVYAKWTAIHYTISYVIDGRATNGNVTDYTVETATTALLDPTLAGYTFEGWFVDDAFKTRAYTIGGGEIGDKTFYAKVSANTYNVYLDGTEESSYVVSFDLNGADGSVAAQTITESNPLSYPAAPTRAGYLFGGWYDNAAGEGRLYDFTQQITKDTVLYAKWVSAGSATPIAINSTASVSISGQTDAEYVFLPLVSGNVTITATGSIDTFGRLYNDLGVLLAQDDDSAADGLNFLILYNVTAGKPYTVKVRGFGSAIAGSVTLSVTGNTTVAAGGYVVTPTKRTATYDEAYSLPLPEERDGYKFLGYADGEENMVTDRYGASLTPWSFATDTVLYSVWERTVYTVTFVSNGGSAVDPAVLAYGERLDLNDYLPTLSGKSFTGWYRSLSDTEPYEATVMPDENFTLYAKWKTFSLGNIKYDVDKKAISVNDEISAALFGAICLDSNGDMATFTPSVNGTQAAGETITVRLTAQSGGKSKQVTITDVKVYGAPTLTLSNGDVGYIRLPDGLKASWFGASGQDTFGGTPALSVRIEGEYEAGDTVTVYVDATDVAGNVTTETLEDVKLYGLPTITYNTDKTAISVLDTLNAALFSATAEDSFGEALDVAVSVQSGTVAAGNTVTIRLTATDSKGDVRTVDVTVKVYGAPTISNAVTTEFKVADEITVSALGLTAKDTYNKDLTIELSVKSGTQTAGTTMVYTATVTDVAGNTTEKDVTVQIYGTPALTYNKSALKVTEDPVGAPIILNATATDSFGATLAVTVSLLSGDLSEGGTYVTYRLSAADHLGNVGTLDTDPIPVYDVADISLSLGAYNEIIKLLSCGEEFSPEATDSFGNVCAFSVEAAQGYTLAAGESATIYVVATDPAGNKVYSDALPDIRIYGAPNIAYAYNVLGIASSEISSLDFMFTVTDSFGEELVPDISILSETETVLTVRVSVTDDADNAVEKDFALTTKSYLALYKGDTLLESRLVTIGESYDLPVDFAGYTFVSWKVEGTGSALTDASGHSLTVWFAEETAYRLVVTLTPITYAVTYNLNGGANAAGNIASYTVETIGDGFALLDPTKITAEEVIDATNMGNGMLRITKEVTSYTFLGWYAESTFDTRVTEIAFGMGAVTLFAKWSATTSMSIITVTEKLVNREGNNIYFGSYPQTEVTDNTVTTALRTAAGTLPTSSNSQKWTSYGYYIKGSVSNYMWYIDLEYSGEKYRGVYFTSYRPEYTSYSSFASKSYQDENGYTTESVYWFKYEPIKWRILSEANGEALILCEMIIDSQEYYPSGSTSSFSHNGGTGYANNYALSNIRKWLNDNFYNTAFNDLQKQLILLTTVDNSARSTNPNNNATQWNSGTNTYACADTEDYIFLLSMQEVTNSDYGFDSNCSNYDTARWKQNTDYAKSQGAISGYWWLRSPTVNNMYSVHLVRPVYPVSGVGGVADYSQSVNHTGFGGVVPALRIKL